MKTMRKALALIMALAIVMSLGITAFAETPAADGKIVISKAQKGADYHVYQIFELVGKSADDTLYTYKVAAKWLTHFQPAGALADFVDLTQHGSDYYVSQKAGYSDPDTWAADLAKAISEMPVKPDHDYKAENVQSTEVVIDVTPNGYFFVDTTSGTLCALDTSDKDALIKDKNPPLTVDKEITTHDISKTATTQSVGENVPFKVSFTIKEGAVDYVLKDTMTAGMTFVSADKTSANILKGLKITLDGTVVPHAQHSNVYSDLTTSDTGFELTFKNEWLTANENKAVIVEYEGLVTSEITTTNYSDNTVKIEYGKQGSNGAKLSTNVVTTKTYSFNVPVVKFYEKEGKNLPLSGCTFELRTNKSDGDTALTFTNVGTDYTHAKGTGSATITTTETGKFSVKGLKAGTYYLVETAAPDGYQIAPAKTIVIGTNGNIEGVETIVLNGTDSNADVIGVKNIAGSRLPATGGIGTTIFYTVGGILMVTALALFITKKKMSVN